MSFPAFAMTDIPFGPDIHFTNSQASLGCLVLLKIEGYLIQKPVEVGVADAVADEQEGLIDQQPA